MCIRDSYTEVYAAPLAAGTTLEDIYRTFNVDYPADFKGHSPVSYTHLIAEKPSVTRSIATVIGATEKQNGYWQGGGYLVSWCIGHLVSFCLLYTSRFISLHSLSARPVKPCFTNSAVGRMAWWSDTFLLFSTRPTSGVSASPWAMGLNNFRIQQYRSLCANQKESLMRQMLLKMSCRIALHTAI